MKTSTKFQGASIAKLNVIDSAGEFIYVKYNFVTDRYVCPSCGGVMTRTGNILNCGSRYCHPIEARLADGWAFDLRDEYWCNWVNQNISAGLVAKYLAGEFASQQPKRSFISRLLFGS